MVYVQVQFERKLNCSWEIRGLRSTSSAVFPQSGGWNVVGGSGEGGESEKKQRESGGKTKEGCRC